MLTWTSADRSGWQDFRMGRSHPCRLRRGDLCFSSICSSYPLTIRIASCVKSLRPECTILLGGPQASVVDLGTLGAFPFVDFILRGEAERTLPIFLDEWGGKRRFSTVPGLSYRTPFGPARNEDAAIIEDLDSLPLPAYHLTDELSNAPYASLELGRGCPFACTFCSTNDFFRRKFRVKSPECMLAGMRAIAAAYGLRNFDLVHDMFTVDRRRVEAFCRHMIDSGEDFGWSCSARTDCVDEELLALMAEAGCRGIFFGIESGSRRMQRIIDKDLDPDRAKAMIEAAERLGIPTTVSLITGFPEENCDDLRETVGMYMHSMRHAGSSPQLNLLAPLAGTPVHSQYKDRMVLEDLCSDMSHQGRIQNESDRELIRQFPEIFPNFYLLPAPGLDRAYCMELEGIPGVGARRRSGCSRHDQTSEGILEIFSAWRKRRLELHPNLSGGNLRHYYTLKGFAKEFTGFVRGQLPWLKSFAVEALVNCYEALIEAEDRDADLPREGPPVSGPLLGSDLPVRAPQIHVLELGCDIQSVIDGLKSGEKARTRRARKFYRTGETAEGASRLLEITPRVAGALQICDGLHSVDDFIAGLAELFPGSTKLRRHSARCLLDGIRAKGFIEIHRSALQGDGAYKFRSQRQPKKEAACACGQSLVFSSCRIG